MPLPLSLSCAPAARDERVEEDLDSERRRSALVRDAAGGTWEAERDGAAEGIRAKRWREGRSGVGEEGGGTMRAPREGGVRERKGRLSPLGEQVGRAPGGGVGGEGGGREAGAGGVMRQKG